MSQLILAIDQGTTATTCLLIDRQAGVRAKVTREFPQIFPKPGWVEHDLDAIWDTVADLVPKALDLAGARPAEVAAIGIANQRETTCLWHREDLRPLHNAIVWQCRRTAERCRALAEAGAGSLIQSRTGLVLDPYFSATKIAWLLDAVPGAREAAERGELAFGTIDAFLVARLTGGRAHTTDVTNAARTLLFDIHTCGWDDDLLALFGVPKAVLPQVRGSSELHGTTRGLSFLPDGIPIAGIAGDQQAALFGQAGFERGAVKCTFGTGAFLLMNVGDRPVASKNGLLSTPAWKIGDEVTYALEGSAFIAGAAVQWLRDGLGLIGSASEIEALARSVPESGDVVFVPALSGLGAPHWRPEARGLFAGISRDTSRGHLARALLEGIDFQVWELAEAMRADAGIDLASVKVDGGASANGLLMQFLADLLGAPVIRPRQFETTAFGAAFLAGLATGFWKSREEIAQTWRSDARFEPSLSAPERERQLDKWRRAVQLSWQTRTTY